MHAAVEFQSFEAIFSISLQGATSVNDVVPGCPIAEAVADSRRKFLPRSVLPLGTDSANHVPVFEHFRQAGNLPRIILQIAVQRNHPATLRQPKSGGHSRSLAKILSKMSNPNSRIGLLRAFQCVKSRI